MTRARIFKVTANRPFEPKSFPLKAAPTGAILAANRRQQMECYKDHFIAGQQR
jgi:hypothetical protein